jgi:hypothetical protein
MPLIRRILSLGLAGLAVAAIVPARPRPYGS